MPKRIYEMDPSNGLLGYLIECKEFVYFYTHFCRQVFLSETYPSRVFLLYFVQRYCKVTIAKKNCIELTPENILESEPDTEILISSNLTRPTMTCKKN